MAHSRSTAGHFTGTFIADESDRSDAVAGTYAVSPSGNVTVDAGVQIFNGAMNISKDIVAANPNLQTAAASNQSRLMVLVHSTGEFSNASMKGLWRISLDNAQVVMNLDDAGHITSGTVADKSGGTGTITGTYSVSPAGAINFTVLSHETDGVHQNHSPGLSPPPTTSPSSANPTPDRMGSMIWAF